MAYNSEVARRHNQKLKAWTAERRANLLEAQDGVCAICGTDDPGYKHGWRIDHDHSCCKWAARFTCGECDRGVLCHNCNTRILPALEHKHFKKALTYLGMSLASEETPRVTPRKMRPSERSQSS